jgi:hypothetical protein
MLLLLLLLLLLLPPAGPSGSCQGGECKPERICPSPCPPHPESCKAFACNTTSGQCSIVVNKWVELGVAGVGVLAGCCVGQGFAAIMDYVLQAVCCSLNATYVQRVVVLSRTPVHLRQLFAACQLCMQLVLMLLTRLLLPAVLSALQAKQHHM